MKITIIVLAILLLLSILALGYIYLHKYISADSSTIVEVPDNIITDSKEDASDVVDSSNVIDDSSVSSSEPTSSKPEQAEATLISLNSSIYGDNEPFNLPNMFPGDSLIQYYCVRVSFQDSITLNFDTDITSVSKSLADALKISVKVLGESTPLYNGALSDMPVLEYKLSSAQAVTRDVYFIIEPYLPTSVGNAYQGKNLVVNFNWYVTEVENLKPAPPTGGDGAVTFPWIAVLVVSLGGLVLFCLLRRKEVQNG